MITLYELKQNKGFRCFTRTPFYIKNAVLLGVLSFLMSVIYVLHFRKDGGNLSSIPRILKGLNSQTFNWLQDHSESLRMTKLLNNYQAQVSTNLFMDDCVRITKACKFEGLARTWPGFSKLQYKSYDNKGYDYLKSKLNDMQVEVYLDLEVEQSALLSITGEDSFKL